MPPHAARTTAPRGAGSLQPTGIFREGFFFLFSLSFFLSFLTILSGNWHVLGWRPGNMAFLQIKVAEEVRLWEGQRALPARGQLWPKNRDWDPHGQHGKAKHNFIFLSQAGETGSSCLSINGEDPISGHVCLQELKITSELASRLLTTPQHLRAIPPIASPSSFKPGSNALGRQEQIQSPHEERG